MLREIFIVKNNSVEDIELKEFGVVIAPGESIDLYEYDKAVISEELYNYLSNGTLSRYIDGVEVTNMEFVYNTTNNYYLSDAQYENVITVAKTGSTFTTINSALDSITDNNTNNRYLIEVSPDLYVENITMKPFVTIHGLSSYTRIQGEIVVNFTGSTNSTRLDNIELRNYNKETINIDTPGIVILSNVNIKTYYNIPSIERIKCIFNIKQGIVSLAGASTVTYYNTNTGTTNNIDTIFYINGTGNTNLSSFNVGQQIFTYEKNTYVSCVYNENTNSLTELNIKDTLNYYYLYNNNPVNFVIPIIHSGATNSTSINTSKFFINAPYNVGGTTIMTALSNNTASGSSIYNLFNSYNWNNTQISDGSVFLGAAISSNDNINIMNCFFKTESDNIPIRYDVLGTLGSIYYSVQNNVGTLTNSGELRTETLYVGSDFNYSGATIINKILNEEDLISDSANAIATQHSIKKYVDDSVSGITGGNYVTKITFNTYTGTTGLNEITQINAYSNTNTTFNSGITLNKINPLVDSLTAIQINKADGITPIITYNTISGFTGHGTNTPETIIHIYGTDIDNESLLGLQSNGLKIDGVSGADKEIQWSENGVVQWLAQTYRGENGKFWYLYNQVGDVTPLVVSETGRIGINSPSNIVNKYAIGNINGGLDDIRFSGLYDKNFVSIFEIEIDGIGTPDTFKWRVSYDEGDSYSTWISGVSISTEETLLESGVNIYFLTETGHTLNTKWEKPVFPQLPHGTFTIHPNGFNEILLTDNYNLGTIEYVNYTGEFNSSRQIDGVSIFTSGSSFGAFYAASTTKINSVFFNIISGGEGILLITEYWDGNNWLDISIGNLGYLDDTHNLTESGGVYWDTNSLTNWIIGNIKDYDIDEELYWIRFRSASNVTKQPLLNNIGRNGKERFSIYSSPFDYKPAMYVDLLGRTNIGGGIITRKNKLQITDVDFLDVAVGSGSLVEMDSNDVEAADLRIKLTSNDAYGTGIVIVKTRGELTAAEGVQTGDELGHIWFRARVGSTGATLTSITSEYTGSGDSTSLNGDLIFSTAGGSSPSPTERIRINYLGNTGFGIIDPNATIHIKLGTTTNAPLKFTSGSLLSTPQSGVVEFVGDNFYGTTSGNTRKTFAFLESPQFIGTPSLPSGTTLNNTNLINFILTSGGTNNTSILTINDFNTYTGTTNTTIIGIEDDINDLSGWTATKLDTSVFNTYSGITDTKIDNFTQILSGGTTGITIDAVSFHSDATASVTLSNQSASDQFLANNNRNIRLLNLNNVIQVRLSTRVVTASVSINNPRIILRYSNTFSTTVGNYLDIGVTEVSVPLNVIGVINSGWVTLANGVTGDVFSTIIQRGGDGTADPSIGNIVVEMKKVVQTADINISGITNEIFDEYTGTTELRLQEIESDITGLTETKLDTIIFNTFTGTTLPNNYVDLTNYNFYTGNTDNNITSLSTSVSTEISNRISGDTSLSSSLSIEVSTRVSVDDLLSTSLSTEVSVRLSIDNSLSSTISSETSTRVSVDNSLSTNISQTLTGLTELKLDKSIFDEYSGITELRLQEIESDITGLTETKLDKISFETYSGNTTSKLWNVFQPIDGTTDDTTNFEIYSDTQLLNGQPIFLHDPNDYGFVFSGLTTTKSYNKLPWQGINGGLSAPRVKLNGTQSVFSTVGISGIELFIEAGADITVQGASEHTVIDLTEIRFIPTGTLTTLSLNAVNMTVGRVEANSSNAVLNIMDRTNFQSQSITTVKEINVYGGAIFTSNWLRSGSNLNVGWNGTSKTTVPAIVTIAKSESVTGKIVLYGDNCVITVSQFPITINSGAEHNTIIGNNNTITDLGGSDNIILQNLLSGMTFTNWGSIGGTISGQTDLQNELNLKLDVSDFNTYTGSTLPWAQVSKSGSSLLDLETRNAEDVNISIPNWDSTNVSDFTNKIANYIEDTQGSGRLSPESVLGGLNTTNLIVSGGTGYITYSNYHSVINWSGTTINVSGYTEGTYYVYVDTNSEIQISTSNPDGIHNIRLGTFFWGGSIIGTITQCGCVILNSLTRTINFFLRLGYFIYDDGGSVEIMSGNTRKIVSSPCKVQFGLLDIDLPEISADQASTYQYKYTYISADEGIELNWVFARSGGIVPTGRWNDITKNSHNVLTGYTINFTNGSSMMTSSSDLTSILSSDNFIYLSDDSHTYSIPITGITWTGSETQIYSNFTYLGSTSSGIAIIDESLPKIPSGKYVKSLIVRTTDSQLILFPSQTYYDNEDDAINGVLPQVPTELNQGAIKMAYIVHIAEELDLTGKIYDIRPLPFHDREGGQSGGGTIVTNHGSLTGLGNDDHLQYLRTDGTRLLTGIQKYQSHPTFTTNTDLIDKKYVDDSLIPYLSSSIFNTFTGTTLPNNYLNLTDFNFYSGNTNNNIISLSTSLSGEISIRDSVDNSLSSSISTEISIISSNETSLSTSLSTEVSTRGSVDNSLSSSLLTRTSVDNSLSTSLSGEISTRSSSDVSLSSSLSIRTSVDNSLSTSLSGEISTRGSVDNSLSTLLSSSLSTRTSVDNSLSTSLSGEISTRSSSDVSLSSSLSIRTSVDNSLSTLLSGEISTRSSSDVSLSSSLSTRTSVDNSLSTSLSTETSSRTSVDGSLSTSLSTRTSVDNSLSSSLSTEVSTRGSVDNSLSSSLSVQISTYIIYTGTTVPNTYANLSDFDTYVTTTAPTTYLSITNFNIYSGDTKNELDDKLYYSEFNDFVSNVLPLIYLNINDFNIYTGTTVPATYVNLSTYNTYTGNTLTLIGTKQNTITGGATTITSSNLTINRALVSDGSGKVGVSNTTSTQIGYLSGTTSDIQGQLNLKAPLLSPTLTGTPLAPTAAVNTSTTQIATTAYVVGQASATNPLMNGSVLIGTSLRYSREDHVHPIDTSRVAKSGDTMTGVLNGTSINLSNDLSITGSTYLGNVTSGTSSNFVVIDNVTKKLANSGLKYHVYGSEFQYAESLAQSTTTSTTPQIKVTLTTTNLPSGLYKISGVARGRNSTTNSDMRFQIYQNASPLGTTDINIESQDASSYFPIVMVHFLNLSGVQTFTLRYWSENGGATTYITDATLELIRVS
jgi:hypothetical protein